MKLSISLFQQAPICAPRNSSTPLDPQRSPHRALGPLRKRRCVTLTTARRDKLCAGVAALLLEGWPLSSCLSWTSNIVWELHTVGRGWPSRKSSVQSACTRRLRHLFRARLRQQDLGCQEKLAVHSTGTRWSKGKSHTKCHTCIIHTHLYVHCMYQGWALHRGQLRNSPARDGRCSCPTVRPCCVPTILQHQLGQVVGKKTPLVLPSPRQRSLLLLQDCLKLML